MILIFEEKKRLSLNDRQNNIYIFRYDDYSLIEFVYLRSIICWNIFISRIIE